MLKFRSVAVLILGCLYLSARSQTCQSDAFTVSNGQVDYLKIDKTGVYGCSDMRNLCEKTSVELYLSADGTTLSTSSGSSVQLPDPSSTNELQQLALSGNQLSISSGNAVQLPMLQDWLTVHPNKADSTTAPTEKQFTFLTQGLKSGTALSFDLTTASVLINKSGTYLLSLTVTHWSDPNAQIVRSSLKKQDGSYAVVVTSSQTTGLQVSSTQIVHLNAGDTLRWFLSGGNIAIGDASNASGINILLLRED